jgi:C4-dicarboxylate transporter DctQ subunit
MKFDKAVEFLEEAVCLLSLTAIVSLVVIQVFFRYVLSSGILWLDEIVTNLMVLMVMFGAALATRNMAHTELKVLLGRASPKIAFIMKLFAIAIVTAFLLILIYYSALHAYNSRKLSTIMVDIPLWLVYGIIPAGGVLMFYEFAKQIPRQLFPPQKNGKRG